MIEPLTTASAAATEIEERQRLMSGEDARPSESSPLPGSSGGAAAVTGHKVQFAAASSALDDTDEAGSGGGGRGGMEDARAATIPGVGVAGPNLDPLFCGSHAKVGCTLLRNCCILLILEQTPETQSLVLTLYMP